jgi:signal peptidase II
MQEEGCQQPSLIYLALVGLGIILADTISKILALQLPAAGVWLFSNLGFKLIFNRGIAFGLGDGWLPISLQLLATAAILVWLCRLFKKPSTSQINYFAGVLIFSGALANIIDRLADGKITDFIILGPWPAFNIADSAITLGVATILIKSLAPGRSAKLTQ